MFNDQLLAGRRILVTGGGTGLGKSMASRFLELGAEVHICGRRKSVCDETATELMDLHGGRVVSHGVDIRNALAVDEMIEQISYRETRAYVKSVLRNLRTYHRLYADAAVAAVVRAEP